MPKLALFSFEDPWRYDGEEATALTTRTVGCDCFHNEPSSYYTRSSRTIRRRSMRRPNSSIRSRHWATSPQNRSVTMPRNVRNFWIELDVDGKKERIATGPRNAAGGFDLTVKMRDEGGIVTALDILGRAHSDGSLLLNARSNRAQSEVTVKTKR